MSIEPQVDSIRSERIKAVLGQTPLTLGVTMANAGLTAAVMRPVIEQSYLLIWIALLLLVSGARAGVWLIHRRNSSLSGRLRRWTTLVTGGSFASGLLWGLGATLFLPQSDIYQLFLAFVLGGMCAGAATVYSAHFPTALAFIVPAALPFAIRLAAEGSTPRLISAVMILIFVAALLLSACRASKAFGNTLSLQHELAGVNARLRREIAGHRSTEATLRQAQKMEAIGQLTGGIAHDFNNLLTAVIGNLDLIAHAAAGNEKITRLTNSAIGAAERGASLTGSLLAFARLQSVTSQPVSVNSLLQEFSALLQQAAGKTVMLELTLHPAVEICQIDPAQFQSAMLNLVINARDSMLDGGWIVIATANVRLDAADLAGNPEAEPGPFVAVSVRDTGTGMDEYVVARAFEPFFTTKEVGKGSGLGLSQVYGFARQAHGHVKIDSQVGQGTVVTMYLPEGKRSGLLQVEEETASLSDLAQLRILVVEDDPDVLEAVGTSIREAGFEVITATGGSAALRILQSDQPVDILFSDIVMPGGMSGIELARKARVIRPEFPVILTSGFAASSLQSHDALEGEFELLKKPYRQAELIERFRSAIK